MNSYINDQEISVLANVIYEEVNTLDFRDVLTLVRDNLEFGRNVEGLTEAIACDLILNEHLHDEEILNFVINVTDNFSELTGEQSEKY